MIVLGQKMMWYIPLIISILAAAIATLLQRFIQRDSRLNPLGFYIVTGATATVSLLLILVIRGLDTRWELLPLPNLFLSAVFWTLANVFLLYALKRTEASQFVVIFSTRVIWSLLVAIIFLNESLSFLGILGTLILLIGAMLAVWEKGVQLRSPKIIYSILAALFFGVAVANDGIVLARGYDVFSYFLFAFFVPALIIFVISSEARKSAGIIAKAKRLNLQVVLLGILYTVSSVTLLTAFQLKKEFSVLLSLNQLHTIIVVIGAMILLHERKYIERRLFAAVISIAGALLVILG